MTGGLTLGPFSFSTGLLTTFAAIVAIMIVGDLAGRRRGVNIERSLWLVIVVAVLAARAVYVARFADVYLASPLSILSIRDGGFSAAGAVLAGLACAAFLGWRRHRQRKPLMLAAAAGAAVFALVAAVGKVFPPPSAPLPQLVLSRLDGGSLALSDLAGKPVVLNLWASWCGPCRREMPVLRQVQRDHPEVTFIFVNQGEPAETIRAYLTAQNLKLDNVVLDRRSQMGAALGSKALPTTFFFDGRGVMRARRVGEVSAATLAEQLASLK
jgi:thiol-disulfide isomerase/thioredoxin